MAITEKTVAHRWENKYLILNNRQHQTQEIGVRGGIWIRKMKFCK